MKKMTLEQMATVEGGKFWGNGEPRCTTINNGAGQDLYEWCCQDYFVFWIKVDTSCGIREEMV